MTNRNEVWAEGAQPGDAPISSVVVPVDPAEAARTVAQERIRAFGRGPRPATPNALQTLHDVVIALQLDE